MQLPIQLYTVEIRFRACYFLLSFLFCLLVAFSYHESIFFLETHSFSFIKKKNFIATHIVELFSTSIHICLRLVLIVNIPYAYYHCSRYLHTSWYKSQVHLFRTLFVSPMILFVLGIFISYAFIIPSVTTFFETWDITAVHAIEIQLEARIKTYVNWTLQMAFFFSNISFIIWFKLMYSNIVDGMTNLHFIFRTSRKYFLFCICFFVSMFLPPEGFIQVTIILGVVVVTEIFFLITCIFFAKNNV